MRAANIFYISVLRQNDAETTVKNNGCLSSDGDRYCYNHNRSSLHDIGKIRIPEEILNKPGRLTDEEFKIMKTQVRLEHP